MRFSRLVAILVFVFAAGSFAQNAISVHSGILVSAFEDQDESATAIPIGANFGMMVGENLEAGAEFGLLVSPFEFESEGLGTTVTSKISQTIIGVFGRYHFPMNGIMPYAKAGLGYYMGTFEAESDFGSGEEDFKGAIGFNIGAGVNTEMGIYGEFVFHIVSRELDMDGAESFGANNWGVNVGYRLPLN